MWELALIAENFDVRRQAIFDDIDRKDGPMWSQVYAICMDVIKGIETRVDDYGKPPALVQPEPPVELQKHRVAAPPRDEPISNSRASARGGVEKAVDYVARSPGETPASKLSPIVKKHWKEAKDRMLTKEQQEAMTPDHVKGQFELFAVQLLKLDYIGPLFRHDFRTRFTATVLGVPHVEPTLYTNAVAALCKLAVQSLQEDKFGNVHRDVASIVRTLTMVIKKVEALKSGFSTHWTDVTGVRDTPEVDEVLDAMRAGLELVLAHFEPYSSDLRLTSTDLRAAKEVMSKPKSEVVDKPKVKEAVPPKENSNASRRHRSQRGPEME
jgi:nucleoporin NDC1